MTKKAELKVKTVAKTKLPGVKRKASDAETSLHEDEAERKRFSEVVEERMKLDDANARREARVAKEKEVAKSRGVIYIGHLPHGFYEDQLRKYFSQFGEVTRVRVSRSRKTGGSRGYAFVEFLHDSVAKVAAETMDGYLMFERLLKCAVVPKDKVHPDMFSPRFPFPLNREITRTFINMERTETRCSRNQELRLTRLQQQMESLKNLGIEYEVTPKGVLPEHKDKLKKSTIGETKQLEKTKRPLVKKKKTKSREEETEKHVLLVDAEDDEIEFKTPPHAVRKVKARPKTASGHHRSLEKSSDRGTKKRLSATNKRPKIFE